jgi:hypothetical protein
MNIYNLQSLTSHFRSRFKYIINRLIQSKKYLLTKEAIAFLQDEAKQSVMTGQERRDTLKYLKKNLVEVFNAPFVLKYKYRKIKVMLDSKNGMHYVITEEGRRLYAPRGMKEKNVRMMYNFLCMEQDEQSPHNYCFSDIRINSDTELADIGAGDGNFTLKHITKIRKAYLFECEPNWIEALEATFAPWKEKVVIVNKRVSNKNDNDCVTLDTFFEQPEKPTLLKIDVEGAECQVLESASKLLESGSVGDLLVCAYHRENDDKILSELLLEKGYRVTVSPGILFFSQDSSFSVNARFDFRKGVLHAAK